MQKFNHMCSLDQSQLLGIKFVQPGGKNLFRSMLKQPRQLFIMTRFNSSSKKFKRYIRF